MISPATTSLQTTIARLFVRKLFPNMGARRIHSVRINVTPTKTLRAASVKVRIEVLASVRVVCKMPCTMTVTHRTRDVMRVWANPHSHILESPRMRVVPVTVACFVLHALRISDVDDFLKIILPFNLSTKQQTKTTHQLPQE